MKRTNKFLYIVNLFAVSFILFLNIEEYIPNLKTPTYLISAINQKNEKSNDTEVWISNYKKPVLINKDIKNWFKKDGAYYSNGKEENYINIRNQEKITFIKHQWSGIVSIENTNTKEKEIIDLYSTTDDSYIYNLKILPTNHFFYYLIRILIFSFTIAFINILIKLVFLIKTPKFKFNLKISDKTIIISIIFFSLIPIIYLVTFYPGLLSGDSLGQWKQLTDFQFIDAHPAFHTLIYWLITRIYYSPVSIVIFQIISLSAIWVYGILSLIKNLKPNNLNRLLIILISLIFFAAPQNGLMAITLWKDVLFSYSILFLTINLFNIIFDIKWINKKNNQILLISSLVLVCLLRHNGIITFISTIVSLILIYKTKFLKITLISILVILLIKYPLYKILKVNKIEETFSSGYTLNYLNGYFYENQISKEKYKEFYNSLYPQKQASTFYNSYCINYGGNGLEKDFFIKNNNKINQYLKKEIIDNPNIFLKLIKKRASLVWQIKQPSDSYTYTTPIDDYKSRTILKENYNIDSFNPDSKLTFFIRKLVYLTESEKYKSLFWRPALSLIIILLISLYLFKKNKNNLLLLPLIPVITLSAGLILTIPGQDYRYLFSNYLISIYFILILLVFNKKLR